MTDKEKLLKLRKLANAMYYAAKHLTTDASRLHNAMDEYHQFIIHEYHKEEPTAKIHGWVARQPEGDLWLFAEPPYYNSSLGNWGTAIGGERELEGINTTMFKNLQFYDEPIEVELIIRKV